MAGPGEKRAQGYCIGTTGVSQRLRQEEAVYVKPGDGRDTATAGEGFGGAVGLEGVPFFKRQTKQVRDLTPELCLHGLASGDFELALRGLLGDGAPLSATSLQRLKVKWQNNMSSG